ncbi:MAG: TonB-dependent receptor [Cytophagales bacterium]|nr:TonB-dependent receptor [Cytophagales bacterium]
MKKRSINLLIKMSRNFLLGILLQTLLVSLVFSSDFANAQKLKSVYLSIDAGDISLQESFRLIEEKTEFRFSFNPKKIPVKRKVNIDTPKESLESMLLKLSKALKIKFIRINHQVVVSKTEKGQKPVQEISRPVDQQVEGKVADSETGEPIPGANVLIKGTNVGTVTDLAGGFSLEVANRDAVLIISYVGFVSAELTVGAQTFIEVNLVPDLDQLEEIVVVGYGNTKKKDLTGAVEEVEAVRDITSRPINSTQQILQGNVAGVTVVNDGGDPTQAPIVRVRGIGTLSNEEPLYVVDGVPGAPLPNPVDIASISVLKDASAAAIYGVRAAAGVILVETKQGESGKPKVAINSYYGFQEAWKTLDPLNAREYADVMNLAFDNAGFAADDPRRDYIDETKNPYGFVTRTDWMDEIFRKATMQNYDLSVSGGSDHGVFLASLGYREIEGTLVNTEAERYSLRLNSSFTLNDKITVGENFSLFFTDGNYGVETNSAYTGAIISAVYYPPSAVVWEDEAGNLYGGVTPRDNLAYAGSYGDLINPVAYLNRLDNRRPTTTLSGNIFADYEIIEGLKYRLNVGLTRANTTAKRFISKVTEPGKIFNFNELTQSNEITNSYVVENTLSFERFISDHHYINILGGYMVQENRFEFFRMTARGFEDEHPDRRFFPNASGPYDEPEGGRTENRLISLLGRINYAYKDKYLLTGTVRRDGTSKLTRDNRHGVFPSISAAWKISNEPFLGNTDFIDDLKLRASWGEIGNLGVLGDYATSVNLTRTRALLGDPASYEYYGFAINGIANPDLRWETTTQTDIGIDASFLDDKVRISADYFIKETDDMLLSIPISGSAGVGNAPFENMGSVKNTGFELTLGYHQHKADFRYDISANISSIKNEVTSLGNNQDYIQHNNAVRGILNPLRTEVGHALYSFYVFETGGIFQSTEEVNAHQGPDGDLIQPLAQAGDLRFVDQNGDGRLNEDDRVFKGDAFPDFTYAVNARFEYKGFDLTLFFQGVENVKVFNGLKFSTLKPTQGYNMLSDIQDAWSPANPGSAIPGISLNDDNNNFGTVSDWYLEDASYLRLKNLTLGYSLPMPLVDNAGIGHLRIYLTATNLFTITEYTGLDPEVIVGNGIDVGRYPQSRSFIAGINLQF